MIDLGARSPGRGATPARVARTGALALTALAVCLATLAAAPPPAASGHAQRPEAPAAAPNLEAWTGGVNLYREGVFTTQASWLYCTAADVQISLNMVQGTEDHSGSTQTAYFDWMRTQNQYDLPLSAGVDPAGWTAGMRHFVDDRYRLVSSTSFGFSLQLAATRLRMTGLPVALAVAHGNHGWLLNGFTATADPAATADFAITSVSVTGPLWGLQSKNGYDMPPNTTLTVEQLQGFFTRWHYDPLPMIWDGTFVSIQPLTDEELAAAVAPTPAPPPTPAPTAAPTPNPTPPPTPTATLTPTDSGPPDVAAASAPISTLPAVDPDRPVDAADGSQTWLGVGVLLLLAAGAVVAVGIARGRLRRR